MSPRQIALLRAAILVAVVIGLFLLFPRALAFSELAARELRFLWWLILLVLLGCWLLWASRKRP
ncbi:MAG TPA: hypothetical protein VL527_00575 [Dongiaceae bacterium]|jgi:hypothetical protein|nr:hypothetical protein [Dongiaceae bacterium]